MGKYILFDNNDDYDFLLSDFDGAFYSPERKSKIVSWLNGAYVALKGTKRDDTIVCWYDFQAVILFWLSKLFSRRNIICLNILLKPKNTIKNKFVTFLYKSALKSDNFNATISSCEYGSLLNKKFGRVFHYSLLYDVYHAYYEVKMLDEVVEPKSVFCGGRNGRDWNFLFSLANCLGIDSKHSRILDLSASSAYLTISSSYPTIRLRCALYVSSIFLVSRNIFTTSGKPPTMTYLYSNSIITV